MAKTEIDSKAAEAASEEQVKETETQAEAEAVKEKEASSEDAQAPEEETGCGLLRYPEEVWESPLPGSRLESAVPGFWRRHL